MSKPNEINIPAIIEDLDKSGKNAVILEWLDLNNKKQTVTILSSNFFARLCKFDLVPRYSVYRISKRGTLIANDEYSDAINKEEFVGAQLDRAEIERLVKKLEKFESLDAELKAEYL
jgi:hypothetical protein